MNFLNFLTNLNDGRQQPETGCYTMEYRARTARYVCEALWRSRISPKRHATKVRSAQIDVLVSAIKEVLQEAVRAGGSSLRDHRKTNGELGYFQKVFAAYDREGEPCIRRDCHGRIKRVVQCGRSTFYCSACQVY